MSMPHTTTALPPTAPALPDAHRATLLEVAAESVRYGVQCRRAMKIEPTRYDPSLREMRATFVTLRLAGELRGCIGVLQASRPLVEDVAENAFAAAFRDRRFQPVTEVEVDRLEYHISILHPPTPMAVETEDDLLAQVRPGIDGLIIEESLRRATFLPDVWRTVPDPSQFLAHLKRKGGWPGDYWSPRIKVWRYTTDSFG